MISGSQAASGGSPEPGPGGQPGHDGGQPRTGHAPPASALRFVLLALLVVVVLAGLGGAVTAPGWTGRYHHDGIAVGVALEVVLLALLGTVLIRGRWAGTSPSVAARLRTALTYALSTAAILVPLVLLGSVHLRPNPNRGSHHPVVTPASRFTLPPTRPSHPSNFPLASVLYGLLAALLVAAVAICVILIRRRLGAVAGPAVGDFDDEPDELRGAVESGQAALRRVDDTRAAIIACYLAMEQSLAAAGTAREIADTPDELLAKAAAAGLVRSGAAARLTGLFYEARFSSHPMADGQRDAAEQALDEIAADLRTKRPVPTDAPGSTR